MSTATVIEASTMSLVAGGDRDAFARVYASLAPRILGLVVRVLRDHHQSEEVTQEVFLEIWQTAKRFDEHRGNPVTWMMTIAHRRAIDRVRASQASRARDVKIGIRDFSDAHDPVTEAGEMSFERIRIMHAMKSLTRLQREAVTMSYYDGLTQGEIAAKLGIPVGTVKTRMRDGLAKLRATMDSPADRLPHLTGGIS